MKFYICEDHQGNTFDCKTKLSEAKHEVLVRIGRCEIDHGRITVVDMEVSAENVRRLLGNVGGYAKGETRFIDVY